MALPALDYLRQALPTAELVFSCSPNFRKLVLPFLNARRIQWCDPRDADFSSFTAGLFLNMDLKLLLRAWKARLRMRVGALSRWPSFLLLNQGIRQVRSSAEKNEGRYTLDLAEHLVELLTNRHLPSEKEPRLTIEGEPSEALIARNILLGLGIQEGDKFIVLHPGTGGTAINLSPNHFVDVAESLEKASGLPLILTQGPSSVDAEVVQYLQQHYKKLPVVRDQELEVIREIFRLAFAVVGPSTGTLHLAHLMGTRTLGLYAPIRAQCPSRWGFWGGEGRADILVPNVECPGTSRCIGPRCKEYFCMEKLPWGRLILEWGNDLKSLE